MFPPFLFFFKTDLFFQKRQILTENKPFTEILRLIILRTLRFRSIKLCRLWLPWTLDIAPLIEHTFGHLLLWLCSQYELLVPLLDRVTHHWSQGNQGSSCELGSPLVATLNTYEPTENWEIHFLEADSEFEQLRNGFRKYNSAGVSGVNTPNKEWAWRYYYD